MSEPERKHHPLAPIELQVLGMFDPAAPRAHDRTTIAFELSGCEPQPPRTFHAFRLVVDHFLSRLTERGLLEADSDGWHRLAPGDGAREAVMVAIAEQAKAAEAHAGRRIATATARKRASTTTESPWQSSASQGR